MALDIYTSTYTAAQQDTLLGKVNSPDSTPTASSTNLVTSGGVYAAIQAAMVHPRSDSTLQVNSTFSTRDVVNVDGEMYMANAPTSDYVVPPVSVTIGGTTSIVTQDGDMVTHGSASSDWDII